MTHHLIWTHDLDHVTVKAECSDLDCIDRYVCEYDCELVTDMRRDADGSVSHGHWTEREDDPRHAMHRTDSCNFVEFLNADTGWLPELSETGHAFEIGRTEIEPVWQGDDGVLWKRVGPAEASSRGEMGGEP